MCYNVIKNLTKLKGDRLKRQNLILAYSGIVLNLCLFFVKLYVSVSTNSLAIYCDGVNNFADVLACGVAVGGIYMALHLGGERGKRAQSLFSFVIGLFVAVAGAYFAYSGIERLMYPIQVTYAANYAFLILVTAAAKLIYGIFAMICNKKHPSPIICALAKDSVLDCAVTAITFVGLVLVTKINFALDGLLAILIGVSICISAIKNIIEQSKYLIFTGDEYEREEN